MTIEAAIGFEAVRNWWGRSFCVWELLEVEGAIGCVAYQRDLALAAILGAEHERLLQSACRVGQGEEGLMRSLRCLSVDGRQVDLQRVGRTQSDCLGERGGSAEPAGVSLQSQSFACSSAHLSFAAPPTPAPLLAIATVASSKLHAAADAIEAPESSSEDTRPKESFMVDVCKKVNAKPLSDARGQLSCVASCARAASVIGWSAASSHASLQPSCASLDDCSNETKGKTYCFQKILTTADISLLILARYFGSIPPRDPLQSSQRLQQVDGRCSEQDALVSGELYTHFNTCAKAPKSRAETRCIRMRTRSMVQEPPNREALHRPLNHGNGPHSKYILTMPPSHSTNNPLTSSPTQCSITTSSDGDVPTVAAPRQNHPFHHHRPLVCWYYRAYIALCKLLLYGSEQQFLVLHSVLMFLAFRSPANSTLYAGPA